MEGGGPMEEGGDAVKPQAAPPPPALAPNVTLGSDLKPKESSTSSQVTSSQALTAYAWSVTLSFSTAYPWVNDWTMVTATANADVGPTPYYIKISRDGTQIASCGSGTTCSVSVSSPSVSASWIGAVIADAAGNVVSDPFIFPSPVSWHCAGFQGLSADNTTLAVGSPAVLTSTSYWNVGPSPFYVAMYDVTGASWMGSCGSGTSCAVTANQGAPTTHVFRASCGPYTQAFPPPGYLELGPARYVTWNNTGYRITLSQTSPGSAIATANIDVGPTPYYIEIFDQGTGALLQTCGTGTTCEIWGGGDRTVVAFITTLTSVISLPNIQASSNSVFLRTVVR
jgi:hypothetical protein